MVAARLGKVVTRQVDTDARAGLDEHTAIEIVGVAVRRATVVVDNTTTQHTGVEDDSIAVGHIHLRLGREVMRRRKKAQRHRH